jgi:pilus assembly protein CpaE
MKARPAVVIVGLDDPAEALALTERLAELYPDTTLFFAGDPDAADLVRRAMRAGVREYLARPPEAAEVQAALRRFQRGRAQVAGGRRATGEIITVFGAKGGLGATFIASTLAVLLAATPGRRAAVVDLNLELGDLATFLNLKPEHSILDIVSPDGEVDSTLIESALASHPSGLRLLAQPDDAADADQISAAEIGQVLSRLKTMFDHVVVDTARRFDERTLEALDLADRILLLVALDLPTIRNGRRCIEVFTRLGYADRLSLVVVRHLASKASERLEKSFGLPVAHRIPDDPATAIAAINAGLPAADVSPEAELTQSLRALAASLAGEPAAAAAGARAAAGDRSGRSGILRRFLSI